VAEEWVFWKLAPERTLGRLRRSQYKTNCSTDLTRANTPDINEYRSRGILEPERAGSTLQRQGGVISIIVL